MNLKNHANISLFAYLIGVLWSLTFSFAEGILIIIVAFLYSKIWHIQNTCFILEEKAEDDIKRRRRTKK